MKRTKNELLEDVKKVLGDRTDDDALALLENVTDSISDKDEDWEKKYNDIVKEKNELDETWRKKYAERFHGNDDNNGNNGRNNVNNGNDNDSDSDDDDGVNTDITINDLFKSEE